jgi:predicted ATP-grasp superfamily ATP-dependent carboligase
VLTRLGHQFSGPGVLFPTTDTTLLTVTRLTIPESRFVTFLPTRRLVETIVNKTQFYRSLAHHHVPHPRTLYPDHLDYAEIEPTLGFPVFIRPSQSLPFFTQFGCKGFVAQTLQEVRKYLRVAEAHQMPVMLQEIIPGPGEAGYSMRGYVDHASQVVALMALQKLQQPSLFTSLTVKRSIPLAHVADAAQALVTYLQTIKYRGLFFAEWKRDPRDGIVKLLEINARSAGGNYFGVTCGMNHVLLAYHDALGRAITPISQYHEGIYGINLLANLRYQLDQLRHGQFSPRTLLPYLQRKQYLIFSWRDGRPFLKVLAQVLNAAIS